MGASTLMSLGVRAMFANQAALQTVGHNIANANTEGYSRQQVELATAGGQFTGAGFFGRGVDVTTVTRAHDAFLTREAAASRSLSESDRVRLAQLERLEVVFPTGEQGIGFTAGRLLNAMVDLASRPQDTATRQVVLSRAAELAQRFSDAGSQLDTLQSGVTQDLKHTVSTVNGLAGQIARLNEEIARVIGAGQPPNDLLDQRDALIAELSGHVQTSTIAAPDGTVGVFIAGGQPLVLGNRASELTVMTHALDPTRSTVGMLDNGQAREIDSELLGGGSIAALLAFQNTDLAAARQQLGQMALALTSEINRQQAEGVDLDGASGAAIFSAIEPRALAARNNLGTATLSLSVSDATRVDAAEYLLRYDGAAWTLTKPGDDGFAARTITNVQLAGGHTLDDLGLTLGPLGGAAQAGDRFLLQPVTRAANAVARVLDDPRGIAAASAPLAVTADAGNTGTASVGTLAFTAPTPAGSAAASIVFGAAVPPSGVAYTWTRGAASGSGTWTPGTPIAIDEFALSLDGVPASGDRFDVAASPGATNNGNALALVALRDRPIVGRRTEAGVAVGGETVTDAYASAMADIGVRVQRADSSSRISGAVADAAEAQRAGKAGVNLDEEAARLIQFQQSYQAAAKVLQVAQSVFDTLLQTAAR